jgi:hypothetical protein
MLKQFVRTGLLVGWFAVVASIVALSVGMGARLSTSALLVLISVAPVCVMLFIGFKAPPPTIAEVLHSVNTNSGRG